MQTLEIQESVHSSAETQTSPEQNPLRLAEMSVADKAEAMKGAASGDEVRDFVTATRNYLHTFEQSVNESVKALGQSSDGEVKKRVVGSFLDSFSRILDANTQQNSDTAPRSKAREALGRSKTLRILGKISLFGAGASVVALTSGAIDAMTATENLKYIMPFAYGIAPVVKGVTKKSSKALASHVSRSVEGAATVSGDDGIRRPKKTQASIDALENVLNEIATENYTGTDESRSPKMVHDMQQALRKSIYGYYGAHGTGVAKGAKEALIGKSVEVILRMLGAGALAGIAEEALTSAIS